MIKDKLLKVQTACINKQFAKNGENPYGNYKYLQLEDFFPFIFNECAKHNLFLDFLFETEENEEISVMKSEEIKIMKSKLVIIDLETEEMYQNTIPSVEIVKLPQMNLMQSLGAYMTYSKKYLLMNTFFVMGLEDLDSVDTTKSVEKPKKIVLTDKQRGALNRIVSDLVKETDSMKKSVFRKHLKKTLEDGEDKDNIIKFVTKNCDKLVKFEEWDL